jgi:hypothetical protein
LNPSFPLNVSLSSSVFSIDCSSLLTSDMFQFLSFFIHKNSVILRFLLYRRVFDFANVFFYYILFILLSYLIS